MHADSDFFYVVALCGYSDADSVTYTMTIEKNMLIYDSYLHYHLSGVAVSPYFQAVDWS